MPLYVLGQDFNYQVIDIDQTGARFSVETAQRKYSDLRIAVSGNFQPLNAALAVASLDLLQEEFDFAMGELVAPQIKSARSSGAN